MRAAAMLLVGLLPVTVHAQGLPTITVPGQGQPAQPMPQQSLPTGQPGQFLPAVPPPVGSVAAPLAGPVQPVQSEWVAQTGIELRAIDKVMARTTTLTGRVGDTLRFGTLTVLVRSCVVRPPDRAPDAAAFLEIGESGKPPSFRGWMVLSVPQLALLEHPTYDIRVAACRP